MENEKIYNIYYGDNKEEYTIRYLKETDIIDGYLTEAAAFELFFDDMIMCNNYLEYHNTNIDYIVSSYDEENDEYIDEYQYFIVNPSFDENTTEKAVKKMGNTLYYDNDLDLYIMGVTDLGSSRTIVSTDIKVKEDKE